MNTKSDVILGVSQIPIYKLSQNEKSGKQSASRSVPKPFLMIKKRLHTTKKSHQLVPFHCLSFKWESRLEQPSQRASHQSA